MDSTSNDRIRPDIGMNFNILDKTWSFGLNMEGKEVLELKKYYTNNSWLETRTNCKVKMGVKHVDDMYKIDEFIEDHNHPLHFQEIVHMLASQRKITKVQEHEIDLATDVELKQKSKFQLISRQTGGRDGLGYTRIDAKSFL